MKSKLHFAQALLYSAALLALAACGGGDTANTPNNTNNTSMMDMSMDTSSQKDSTSTEDQSGMNSQNNTSDMQDMATQNDMMSQNDMMAKQDMTMQQDMMSQEDMTMQQDMTMMSGTVASCLMHIKNYSSTQLKYEDHMPTLGSHCFGTNNQDIKDVEQVVFFGDSVTMGTPPLQGLTLDAVLAELTNPGGSGNLYRGKLAEMIATKFSLDKGSDWEAWKKYDSVKLKSGVVFPTSRDDVEVVPPIQQSGAFLNCSRSGADNDDLIKTMGGRAQLIQCFPNNSGEKYPGTDLLVPGGSDKKTLVIMTMGGNNISKLTQELANDKPARDMAIAKMMVDLRRAIDHLQNPQYFPKGTYIVFANPYGYTDASGTLSSCPGATEAGFNDWSNKQEYVDMLHDINNQYMKVAMETKTDMIFMDEFFCGHGYVAAGASPDTNNACYLGPNQETCFDSTCIHPTQKGHDEIAKMFMATINE